MKKILLAIVGIILLAVVVLGVVVFVSPTDFQVEKEIVINKPKAEVFDYLKYVKNQEKWGPWQKKDPNMVHRYTGTDGEVGFISAWESDHEQVGSGEQEITKIVDGERIDNQVRFKVPFESASDGYFVTEAEGQERTKVKWGFTGSFPRPLNLMLLFIDMDAEVGKDFDEGLKDLKVILEKQENPKSDSNAADAESNTAAGERSEPVR